MEQREKFIESLKAEKKRLDDIEFFIEMKDHWDNKDWDNIRAVNKKQKMVNDLLKEYE